MRDVVIRTVSGLVALVCLAGPARADIVADLREAAEAIARRDLQAASASYRRAFEAEQGTGEQRRQALDGLLVATIELGRAAQLTTYLEQRRAAAPAAQRAILIAALARCQKAIDGHLHGALARLEREAKTGGDRAARRLHGQLRALCYLLGKAVERQARGATLAAMARARRVPKPPRSPRGRVPRVASVPAPQRPVYELRVAHLSPPAGRRLRRALQRIQIPAPTPPRVRSVRTLSVTKPPAAPRRARKLAYYLFSRFYRRASELAAQGYFDSAKTEYAAIIQLFPGTTHAQQAARYAIRLFERERGVGDAAHALVAYLQWIRAVVGPKGSEYAEYLALQRFSSKGDPTIVAREAEAFIKRHPSSDYVPGVRLQLAVALDSIGASRRAIEVIKPIASKLDSELRAKAAHILAWLYIFQGDAKRARPVLQALAAQSVSAQRAAAARRILEQMAASPLLDVRLPAPDGAKAAEEDLADALLEVADGFLRQGDPERAMDLYTLYLEVGDDTPGFWAARMRIERLKQTGRADEE